METVADKGYLIWALGDQYIECAIACARSIKMHTKDTPVCLLTDKTSGYSYKYFDFYETFPHKVNYENTLANDWQIFFASPFTETIKIEADMIVPHSIEHWWTLFRHKDVVLTVGAKDFMNKPAQSRFYRKIFDANNLPDVYNAITYWRRSELAMDFALMVKYIFNRWDLVQPQIKMGMSEPGTTDLVYAIAAQILGVEQFILPNTSIPSMIHMKGHINNLFGEDWTKECVWEFNGSNIRINTIDQQYPFHYYIKEFAQVLNHYYDDCERNNEQFI